MRGKIACSAQKLSLLDPEMVQSVVDGQAYQVGLQYRSENRVRITEADERQITSIVIGNSGVYQVTIQLKDGALTTKCSCPLNNEQPLCRHSIAVLLEYHRWSQAKPAPRPVTKATSTAPPPSAPSGSTLDVKLSDVMVVMEWLQASVRALQQDAPLPDAPSVGGEAVSWIKAMQELDQRRRQSEEKNQLLEADVRARDAHLGRLTEQLQTSMEETKAAQAACDHLRREVAGHVAMQSRYAEIAKTLEGFDGCVKRIGGDVMKHLSELDALANSCKEAAHALQGMTKQA